MHVRMGGDVYRAWAVCVMLLRRVREYLLVGAYGARAARSKVMPALMGASGFAAAL